jgi:hypothetical protein
LWIRRPSIPKKGCLKSLVDKLGFKIPDGIGGIEGVLYSLGSVIPEVGIGVHLLSDFMSKFVEEAAHMEVCAFERNVVFFKPADAVKFMFIKYESVFKAAF